MKIKEEQLYNYLKNLYLPQYFVRYNNGWYLSFNKENIKPLVNQKFTLEELYNYILLHKNQITEQISKQMINKIFEPMYFTVEELIRLQSSDDPFSQEELFDLLASELNRPYDEMNTDVIEYCLDEIERMEKNT